MAYMLEKLLRHLQPCSCLTGEEFLSVPPESSDLFELPFLLVKFDTEKLNINTKVSVAWQKPQPLQRQWQNTLGLLQ